MSFLRRRTTTDPEEPRRTRPTMPGAMLFTLRSVPRHYEPLKDAIESTGEARVYFGEALAYIRGKGIALFRVEATGTDWVDNLYQTWRDLETREAFREARGAGAILPSAWAREAGFGERIEFHHGDGGCSIS
jgi:hypothetical protein